jgi:hypothetical protein
VKINNSSKILIILRYMKQKNLRCLSTLVIAIIISLGIDLVPSKKLSKISFTNIEALASALVLDCWQTVGTNGANLLTHKTYCGDCSAILCDYWSNKSTCTGPGTGPQY